MHVQNVCWTFTSELSETDTITAPEMAVTAAVAICLKGRRRRRRRKWRRWWRWRRRRKYEEEREEKEVELVSDKTMWRMGVVMGTQPRGCQRSKRVRQALKTM